MKRPRSGAYHRDRDCVHRSGPTSSVRASVWWSRRSAIRRLSPHKPRAEPAPGEASLRFHRVRSAPVEVSMFLRMIYDEKLAQAAYLIGCEASGEAIVIDPQRDV